ncbi:GDP-mannose-dependent alpha-(1-2)-phosphatidylinositol mannosyltransferase [Corynebacterium atypicum]|uniref:GDP-mannose-dependent alpha-(1-2)-phosphatidylinositol mannosyltransferase n=1 Tax=Corynebacterium atypicum TaxID=191610 RepID=A0ABN4DCB1_9CORY|nr:glycosyltransferase family 4 protein [Corynebacterium atypicum]AIG64043.1 GDP-mannose-dependent alpha-(1-2)-phosphatidylinositol mannosyltransferase [Corynebacterium atypicum]
MRVGLVCPYSFDQPGGVQAHVLDLAAQLRDRGHVAQVLGPASLDTEMPEWVVKGGRSIAIPYNGSVARLAIGPHVVRAVDTFIRGGRFDILHIHEPNSPSFSMVALARARGPIVATYHASASGSKLLKTFLPVLRPALEKIRGGIAVSELARRWQVEQLGGDPVLIPNGVNTRAFTQARTAHAGLVAPSADTRPVRVVFLGRIDEPRKGLTVLLAALDRMTLRSKVHVTVIGGGRAPQAAGVDFVGRVDEAKKAELLGSADLYVAPNLGGESFGIVLVEAMAAGCAVVASDLEAFAAVCAAERTDPAGVLFPVGDAAALAQTLDRLVADPQLRACYQARGVIRARRYDWADVTRRIEAVYETVADGTTVRVGR